MVLLTFFSKNLSASMHMWKCSCGIEYGISKRSFDSDALIGGPPSGGPPGYMSVPFHTKMAIQGHLYKLTDDGL